MGDLLEIPDRGCTSRLRAIADFNPIGAAGPFHRIELAGVDRDICNIECCGGGCACGSRGGEHWY